jgi:predicted PurR-regulated permease PerM
MEARGEKSFAWGSLSLYLVSMAFVVLCLVLLRPFLAAITGAIVLAIVTDKPHRWVAARLRNPTLAAAISLVAVIFSVVCPAVFLVQSFAHHLLSLMHSVQNGSAIHGLESLLQRSPRATQAIDYFSNNISPAQAMNKGAGFAGAKLASLLGGSVAALTQIIILLFLLFFLYRDKQTALRTLRTMLPLHAEESADLLARITDTVQATVLGRLVVACMQGVVAGTTLALLGVTGASLFGVATAVCAMVPSFGAFLVWLPIAIYLAATHHWVQALILAVVGSLVISTMDNFLYPILVGTHLRLHTVPIFLSILGGVWLFGIPGLVLGPVVFSVTASLLAIWQRRSASPLA